MQITGTGSIVTGGGRGIGKAIVETLLKKGGKVCILDINDEQGQQCVEEFRKAYGESSVFYLHCDVTSADQIQSTYKKSKELMGRLDIVLNNAGYLAEAQWERSIDVNLKGVIHGCKTALELLSKENGNNGGLIINTASLSGLVPYGYPVYVATKYGCIGYTRALAMQAEKDFDKAGIRVNAICPDCVDTDMLDHTCVTQEMFGEKYEEARNYMETGIPFKLKPQDIADGVVELIEDEKHQGTALLVNAYGRHVIKNQEIKSPNI